ncbi:MAG: hypothetical protein A2144_06465 [Chloroflexi bacterium RBG_16_50_9]|nr:MAG: hypothetical protein A2144_06465 [Chloroflexi bacterium RBG_16_50_9]
MRFIGLFISLMAALFLLIGLLPLLGWFNWFTTLPAAVLGAIISAIAAAQSKARSRVALTGLIISLAVFVIALIRLSIGGGIL